jgi:hypothetical protein
LEWLAPENEPNYVRTTDRGDDDVRKLFIGLLLLAACKTTTTVVPASGPTPATSPSSARPALDEFLAAIRAKDLQALGGAWGDNSGAIRDNKRISRDELEKRELLLMCYFNHDSYKVTDDIPVAGGERRMTVALTRGTLTRTTDFFLVSGPTRWYVRTGGIEPVRDLCTRKSPS